MAVCSGVDVALTFPAHFSMPASLSGQQAQAFCLMEGRSLSSVHAVSLTTG